MAHITNLPDEVLAHIADYLGKRDLSTLILTCRHLQQALFRHLWKTITSRSSWLELNIDTLAKHARWIQRLEYIGHLPSEYYRIVFQNLDALHINFCSPKGPMSDSQSTTTGQEIDYTALIRLNPTIKDLYIDVKKMDTSPGF
ncbi:hypothetical protein BGX23_006360 [Mortierella sp. AD031]|nr:hypothetical protein BGX23_006360 [Mortierella sp. AD031]